MDKIRILLADDHAVVRAGLRMIIDAQPDMAVIGEAADGREAIEQAERLLPDMVLLDLTMPGLGGLSALAVIRQKAPGAKILVLTIHDDESYLRRVLETGGSGYVVKKAADTELLSAIRAVKRDEIYIHSSLTRGLLQGEFEQSVKGRRAGALNCFADLSEREKEVLHLLARGYTNRQIAEALFLSVKTIETYRARLMEKLRLRTRAELVRYAFRTGLLTPDA